VSTTNINRQLTIRLQINLLFKCQQTLLLYNFLYALRDLLSILALVQSEKDEHLRDNVIENLQALYKELNELQILYK